MEEPVLESNKRSFIGDSVSFGGRVVFARVLGVSGLR